MKLNIRFITDKKGKKTAVQIPIDEWEKHLWEYRKLLEYRKMKMDLKKAVADIANYESEKKKAKTLNQFLDGL